MDSGKGTRSHSQTRGGHAQLLCKDIKSAFLLVTLNKVKTALAHTKAARWIPHTSTFLAPREFAIGWDKLGEAGKATLYDGAPQGSPLSPILFLIFLAPMLRKVEAEIVLSPSSWRQIYTGMIRPIMLWGMELVWRAEGLSSPEGQDGHGR